jgi:GT2 family glycosyltransferase
MNEGVGGEVASPRRLGVTRNRPGAPVAPAIAGDGERVPPASVGLHFTVLAQLDAAAVVAGGWLDDPAGRVAGITLGGEADDRIELLRDALRLDDRSAREAMAVPDDAAPRLVFLLPIAGAAAAWADGLKLAFHFTDGTVYPGFAAAAGAVGDLDAVVRALPAEEGLRFAERLLAAWGDGRTPLPPLPYRLDTLFEGIHARIDPARNYGTGSSVWPAEGEVEQALRVDRVGILLKGWFYHGPGDAVREVAAKSLLGRRIGLPLPLPRLDRPDLAPRDRAAGFVAFAPASDLAPDDRLWFLEIALQSGMVRRLPFRCPPSPPAMTGIETAFGFIEPVSQHMPQLGGLFRDALSPAVDAFWARTRRDREPAERFAYGAVAAAPQLSIIVPLYGRVDFVRHQIARFSNDPEFRTPSAIELIYVLDDPARRDAFERLCRDVHAIYGVPFRALALSRNLGFSGANNAGALAAAGSLLLFLNSDILPKQPRWAGRLQQLYRGLEGCGILGCRLLLEDGSIQHAGMSFGRSLQQPGCWQNEHPGKGLPVAFDRSRGAVRVPAVTGACLMIERALLAQLGGWPEEYVVGDFEDSDLCLKAYRAGRHVYYTPEVELYHLERQSVKLSGEADWRYARTLYNEWKHTQNWGDLIPKVLEEPGAGRADAGQTADG